MDGLFVARYMYTNAKHLFKGGCASVFLLFSVFLVGCWLAMIEFGAAFHETPSDRVNRLVAWVFIVFLLTAFFIHIIVFLKKIRAVKRTSSNSNSDLVGAPLNQNSEFTFDTDPCCEDKDFKDEQDSPSNGG